MLLELSKIDYFFIVFSLFSGISFMVIGLEKLYKLYFGIILSFLLFIIVNLQLKVLQTQIMTLDDSFLLKNKSFILSFLFTSIPFFGIFMYFTDFISFKITNNKFFSFVIGLLLPFFSLSLFAYIWINSAVPINFLVDFFNGLNQTFIFDFLQDKKYLALYLIFFIIFFRVGIFVFFGLGTYIFKKLYDSLKEDFSGHKSKESNSHGHGTHKEDHHGEHNDHGGGHGGHKEAHHDEHDDHGGGHGHH